MNEFKRLHSIPKTKNLTTHDSHYKSMKERLQEKKKILILVVCLHPLGLDVSQNPKDLLLNLILDLG